VDKYQFFTPSATFRYLPFSFFQQSVRTFRKSVNNNIVASLFSDHVFLLHLFLFQSKLCKVCAAVVIGVMSRAVDTLMATFKPVVEDYHFGCWMITATKCHILASEGPERQMYVLFILFYHIVSVAKFL